MLEHTEFRVSRELTSNLGIVRILSAALRDLDNTQLSDYVHNLRDDEIGVELVLQVYASMWAVVVHFANENE